MAGQSTIVGEVTKEYLEKYPNMFKLALARLMYKENPTVYSSVDNARSRIRYYTGADGSSSLAGLIDRRFIGACQPKTDATPREDFILPKVNNNCLLISDIHIPYHDQSAIEIALKYGKDKNINTIIINGDFVDFVRLSKFTPDPRSRDLRYELDCAYEMMYYIANYFPSAKIFFLPGNHDIRIDSYLRLRAPELLGSNPEMSDLDNFLKFSDFGATYLRNSQIIRTEHLFIGHGHEFRGGAGGVNPARTFSLKTHANFIAGHFHRSSEDSTRELNGSVKTCWSMGCLCGLSPDYMPYNSWNHGFAHLRTFDDGNFKIFNARIDNGKLL